MFKYWKITTIFTFAFISISIYFFYVWRYTKEDPSRPQAADITTITSTPPGGTPENFVQSFLDYLSTHLTDNPLTEFYDTRYVSIDQELDPIWMADKESYYTKTQVDSLVRQNIGGTTARIYSASEVNKLLTSKLDVDDAYTRSEIENLLTEKSADDHAHADAYYTKSESNDLFDDKSNADHTHDPRYYTESETDTLLDAKASLSHSHDDRYFTEAEISTLLGQKSDTTHVHDDRYYTETESNTSMAQGAFSTLLPIQRSYVWIDQMESSWSSFYGNGTISFDTTDYKSGTKSLKVVTSSNATNSGARRTLAAPEDWSGRSVKIFVKADNWDNLQEVKLLISTNGQFVSYYQVNLKTFLTDPANHNNAWVEFVVPTSSFTTSGTPSWTTVNQLIVRGIGVNGQTPSVWFDEYALVTNPASGGMLSFTFDDGHSSDYLQARQSLETYGYKGNIFVIPSLLGTSGRLTQNQVDTMHNQGWEISGHGNTNLTTLSTAEAESDIASTRDYLRSRGYRGSEIYAYPNGGYNATISTLIQKYFSLSRTIIGYNQPIRYMNPTALHSHVVHSTDTSTTVNGWIDTAVTNHEWLILSFHRITDSTPASATEYLTTDLQSIVSHAYTSGIEVLPMAQAMRRLYNY
jgi:peptidoglycan/xylan/chitin deacetylase (PgdA/CDA1 family)